MRREISETQRAWLAHELEDWSTSGLIDAGQAARILDVYQTPEDLGRQRSERGIRVLISLATFLVGLAVLLLVGFNWEALPDPIKLGVIFVTIAAAHAAAFHLRYRLKSPGASEAAYFFACLLFGAGIWLVAQVFNINSSNYDGLWWWALGTLPFAFLLDGMLLHVLLVGLLGLYSAFTILGRIDARMFFFNSWRSLGDGVFSVPLLALAGLAWAYRKKSPRVVGLYVVLLCFWVVLQPFAWGLKDNPVYLIGSIGCLLLILAECHREGSPMALPYRLCGALVVAGVLIPLSYLSFHSQIDLTGYSTGIIVAMTLVLVGSVLAVALRGEWVRRSTTKSISLAQALLVEDRRILPPAFIALAMGAVAFWEILVQEPIVSTVLANGAMIALAFWLIMIGLRQDRGRPFLAGVLYFLLWTILRYIDLFGDMGMLGAAVLFFLCGAALFGVARFWQHRQSGVVRHAGA